MRQYVKPFVTFSVVTDESADINDITHSDFFICRLMRNFKWWELIWIRILNEPNIRKCLCVLRGKPYI